MDPAIERSDQIIQLCLAAHDKPLEYFLGHLVSIATIAIARSLLIRATER
jgi:hypothetical protein